MKFDPVNLDWKGAHDLVAAIVVPRPIALISTIGQDGVLNVAPFSFFCPVAVKPMLIGFNVGWKRDGSKKDTLVNIEFSGDFVISVVTEEMAEAMNKTSAPYPSHVDEFKEAGLTPLQADLVKPPLVAESPINMECRAVQILVFGDAPRRASFIFGEVLRVHIKDELYAEEDFVDMSRLKAIARMADEIYCRTSDTFKMKQPR